MFKRTRLPDAVTHAELGLISSVDLPPRSKSGAPDDVVGGSLVFWPRRVDSDTPTPIPVLGSGWAQEEDCGLP